MEMTRLVHSRAVQAAGYDVASRTLRIRFYGGRSYDYLEVPPDVFAGLTTSAHPWTAWGQHIKETYAVRRLQ